MTMTPRRIRSCRSCGRLTLRRLCGICFDEMHAAAIARGTVARPPTPLVPATIVFPDPQPTKDNHD